MTSRIHTYTLHVHATWNAVTLVWGSLRLLPIIRLTHANVWKSMGKSYSCMQFIKSHILVMWESLSVLQITCTMSECAMKSIKSLNDNISITIVTKLYKKSLGLLPLALLLMRRTRNNTDGNKLVIFSCIALYYGDRLTLFISCCPGQFIPLKYNAIFLVLQAGRVWMILLSLVS